MVAGLTWHFTEICWNIEDPQKTKSLMTKLDTPFPVNFVCPEELVWPELKEGQELPLTGETLSRRSGKLTNNWVLRPYHGLLSRGENVSLSNMAVSGAINIASLHEISRCRVRGDEFVVCAHGDAHPTRYANFRIRQNFLRAPTAVTANVLHFPQPGLIPRDPARGTRVERITFKGHSSLTKDLLSDRFAAELRDIGIEFEKDYRSFETGQHRWNDYRNADVVLAVRNVTRYKASFKPASKLINAWMAGVPALLGPEPAFEELRKSDLDFITVKSSDDVLRELQRLQRSPDLYRAMVENGLQRSQDYTEDSVLDAWIKILNGPVASLSRRWYAQPPTYRRLQVNIRRIEEQFCVRIHDLRRRHGKNLML